MEKELGVKTADNPEASYLHAHFKSRRLSFILTLLLGPLGLLYISWKAALLLTILALVTALTIYVPILCWLLSVIYGQMWVSEHNQKIKTALAVSKKDDLILRAKAKRKT